MSALLDREEVITLQDSQEYEAIPGCSQPYQPFVLMWSEQEQQTVASWEYSNSSDGMTVLDLRNTTKGHDVQQLSSDGNGGPVFYECVWSV